jgi:hypothetical protein
MLAVVGRDKKKALTPEKTIGRVHKNLSVSRAPWIGAEPSEPKLLKASASPIRALVSKYVRNR